METVTENIESENGAGRYSVLHQIAFVVATGASAFLVAYGISATISFMEIVAQGGMVLGIVDKLAIALAFAKYSLITVPVAFLSFFKGFNVNRPILYRIIFYVSWVPVGVFAYIMVTDFADPAIQLFEDLGIYAFPAFPLDLLISLLRVLPFFIGLYFYKRAYQRPPMSADRSEQDQALGT